MTNILGPYCSFWHWRQEDEDYIRRLDPAWVRIHQPTAKAIHVVQSNAPNAKIMLRSWDIDDSNGERKREMYNRPKDAAHIHLGKWNSKVLELEAELNRNGWAYDKTRWHMGLVNEPDPSYVSQTVEYSLEAMWIAKEWGWHLGVVVSSVGTFSKPSENDRGWTLCMPLEKPINDGGHILMVHEYWQPEGPNFGEDGGNLAWRHRIIPLDVPILIAESGANGYIYGRHSQNDDAGWQKFMQPEQYAAQVREYIAGCDQRVEGVLLYMLDFHSDQWWSFDTQPAMEQLLAIANTRPQVPSPFAEPPALPPIPQPQEPLTIHLPDIAVGELITAYVVARSGANLRTAPDIETGVIQVAIPFGESVLLHSYEIGSDGKRWARAWYGRLSGWIRDNLLSADKPVQVDNDHRLEAEDKRETWRRSIAFVRRWEGGWADDPNDPGGATNKGITIGTFTAWRAAHGQQTPTKDDLRALTDEEAGRIFFEWYWLPSGADKLPWPMCLATFDLAVNGGIGRAKEAFAAVGHNNLLAYMAWRLDWYCGLDGFKYFGRAWTRRCADLLREASNG